MSRIDETLPVAGVVPLTTVDYPGHLALVVFTQGCPWRCSYCHNAVLRAFGSPTGQSWNQVTDLLDRRRGYLEAVVFSGGEPTLHVGLAPALSEVRKMGFLTGLHTAGMFPERLGRLLPLLDWVGLDVKAPLDGRYARLTGDRHSAPRVRASLDLVRNSGTPFQLRTTLARGEESEREFAELCSQLENLGLPRPVRQEARPARREVPAGDDPSFASRRVASPSRAEMPHQELHAQA